jgi:hypothetical protein
MRAAEIVEGAVSIFAKQGNKMVRKYRCTDGHRKGRVVANAATCNKAVNAVKRNTIKRTKSAQASKIAVNTKRTKRVNPVSSRVRRLNKVARPRRRKSKAKRI